jgi:GTP-binding protein
VVLAINKMDLEKQMGDFSDYYSLGLDRIFPVSSIHGDGVADLLEYLCTITPESDEEEIVIPPKVAIIKAVHPVLACLFVLICVTLCQNIKYE